MVTSVVTSEFNLSMISDKFTFQILAEFYSIRKVRSGLELPVEDCVCQGFLDGTHQIDSHGCHKVIQPWMPVCCRSRKHSS